MSYAVKWVDAEGEVWWLGLTKSRCYIRWLGDKDGRFEFSDRDRALYAKLEFQVKEGYTVVVKCGQ